MGRVSEWDGCLITLDRANSIVFLVESIDFIALIIK